MIQEVLSPQGTWDSGTQYQKTTISGQAAIGLYYVSVPMVNYNGVAYYAKVDAPDLGTDPATNTTDWQQISGDADVTLPTTSGNIAVYNSTSGGLGKNATGLNTVTNTSATPGTVRSLTGAMSSTITTMTSGNLVGVRGSVTCVGASGGFLYGTQGKVIASGTLSGSSWTAPVFGQLDISAATINAGQTAAIWGDYGTTSGTITDATGMRGIAMTNTTAAVLNAQDYRYGNATYLQELAGAGGTLNYYADAGTSAGSAGDATHCAAQKVLKILVNGVAAYIPVFTQNT